MRLFFLLLLVSPVSAAGPAMPDPHLTPGAAGRLTKQQVCDPGLAKTFSDLPMSVQKEVMRRYGKSDTDLPSYEVDHLIPLELGGADSLNNLWPQPYEPRPGAHEKDRLELYLQQQVCSGKMTLQEAQAAIRKNWFAAYERMEKKQPTQ